MATDYSLPVDLSVVPWSLRGSYLCLATRAGENGILTPNADVCLVSHYHPAGLPLFALRPCVHGALPPPSGFHKSPSPVEMSATPATVKWIYKGDTVAEACFRDVSSVHIEGTIPMSLDTEGSLAVEAWRNWLFALPSSSPSVEFTSRPNTALIFEAIQGSFELTNDGPSANLNRRITINPSPFGTWEVIIRERDDAPASLVHRPMHESADRNQDLFARYCRDLCPWRRDWSSEESRTDQLAAYVMWTSTVRPSGAFKSEAVLMSKLWMNKVWSWDNCFNCLALATVSPEAALNQMLLPFDHITREGRLPDSMCHSEILYDYTKPPIYGWVIFKLLDLLDPQGKQRGFDLLPQDRLADIYDAIALHTKYWFRHRRAEGSRVPYYTHGNDSGWDNATCFDHQTTCIAPDLAAFLIVQTDMLSKLADRLSRTEDATFWARKRDEMNDALIAELWDADRETFLFKDAYNGTSWTTDTLLKYIPLVAASYLPTSIVKAMASAVTGHLGQWGLATEKVSSDKYDRDGYWRGPIWAPPTLVIESGLRQAGYVDLADDISNKYQKLCAKSGFAENYDAKTGTGNRDLSYTWSASTYLVLRREQSIRGDLLG